MKLAQLMVVSQAATFKLGHTEPKEKNPNQPTKFLKQGPACCEVWHNLKP